MVEIVCSQRDRFKGRALELEADARKLRNQLAEVQVPTYLPTDSLLDSSSLSNFLSLLGRNRIVALG